jgi:hypothetical protein
MKILLVILVLISLSSCAEEPTWYVMARHGECYQLSDFAKQEERIKDTKSPEEIVNKLKQASINYTLEPFMKEKPGMLQLNVPSMGWSLILVHEKYCGEFAENKL